MSLRKANLLFIAGAALFWLSWLFMPGVGVTDAAQIFDLVAHKRSSVMLSVVTQLLSAALYVKQGLYPTEQQVAELRLTVRVEVDNFTIEHAAPILRSRANASHSPGKLLKVSPFREMRRTPFLSE
jgi:hypothetical protein